MNSILININQEKISLKRQRLVKKNFFWTTNLLITINYQLRLGDQIPIFRVDTKFSLTKDFHGRIYRLIWPTILLNNNIVGILESNFILLWPDEEVFYFSDFIVHIDWTYEQFEGDKENAKNISKN